MTSPDPFESKELDRIQAFICLVPVIGFLPALWTLYRRQGNRERRSASRLAVVLTTTWIVGYVLLGGVAQAADTPTVALLLLTSLLTSGYFLANLWLMVRLWRRKALRLPGFSDLGDRLP